MPNRLIRYLLIILGTISLVIGVIGIFIPVLPTTPFLLMAAACYMRSSTRFYNWLLNNRLFGNYIRNYIEGRGMPLSTKIYTLLFLWVTIGFSIFLANQNMVVIIILLLVATGVTIHILSIRSKMKR